MACTHYDRSDYFDTMACVTNIYLALQLNITQKIHYNPYLNFQRIVLQSELF